MERKLVLIGFIILFSVGINAQNNPFLAEKYFRQGEWSKAYEALEKITSQNPYNSDYWKYFAKSAQKLGKHEQSIKLFNKARETGANTFMVDYEIAKNYAHLNKRDSAVHVLKKSWESGSLFAENAIKDPGFNGEITLNDLTKPKAISSNQKIDWIADLDYLNNILHSRHFNMFHTVDKSAWNASVNGLKKKIPNLGDKQIVMEFMKLMAQVGDGHTLFLPSFQGDLGFKALPLEFYVFKDGLFIRGAHPDYGPLVGSKVVKIAGMETDLVLDKIISYLSLDNDIQSRWILPVALAMDATNIVLGLEDPEKIELTLQTPDGGLTTKSIHYGPLQHNIMGRFSPEYWTEMSQNTPKTNPLWTSNPEDHYWYQFLKDKKMVYCQFNQVIPKEGQSISEFSKELRTFIEQNDVNSLVIDLRLNNGGNNTLNNQLIHEIIRAEKIFETGKLFVIIGRMTFSAAMNLASKFEQQTPAIFVGEPTGSRPNHYGEDSFFTLPNSGLSGTISTRYWQGGINSLDRRPWIAPDIAAELNSSDYADGIDPAMEAIFRFLQMPE